MSQQIDLRVQLLGVRLSFPHIAEPQANKEDPNKKPRYNAEFILEPNNPGWTKFHEVVAHIAGEKWKHQAQQVIQMVQQDRKKRCYGWGQEKVNQKTLLVYDGYQNNFFIGASSETAPQIFDHTGALVQPNTPMWNELARKLYGGCYVNAVIKPWLQENQHGRGIRADFLGIQFLKDGDPFGEGVKDASDMFGATPQAPVGAVPGVGGMPWMPGAPAAPSTSAWTVPGAPAAPAAQPVMPPPPNFGAAPGVPSWGAPR